MNSTRTRYHGGIAGFVTAAILAVVLFGAGALAADAFPRLRLDNGVISMSLYLPDAERGYYRGTRFDWSGMVERVDYAGHVFYAPLHAEHDPLRHDSLGGPAGEFAMFEPMGFAEAGEGESFVKIGVGLLQKKSAGAYRFDGDYPLLRAGSWQIDSDSDRVSFFQDFSGERGWGYRYRKTIRLVPGEAEFVIEQRLENSGRKIIDIDYYNHNFTLIDGLPYGPDYRVEFPFSTAQPVPINDLAWFRGNAVEVDEALGERSLWRVLFEGEDPGGYNAAAVRNLRSGAAVAFAGDPPITRMVFWAVERAACPEPFIRLYLPPGESMQWSSRYRLSAGNG